MLHEIINHIKSLFPCAHRWSKDKQMSINGRICIGKRCKKCGKIQEVPYGKGV